jgi:hypothetical protein
MVQADALPVILAARLRAWWNSAVRADTLKKGNPIYAMFGPDRGA